MAVFLCVIICLVDAQRVTHDEEIFPEQGIFGSNGFHGYDETVVDEAKPDSKPVKDEVAPQEKQFTFGLDATTGQTGYYPSYQPHVIELGRRRR